MRLAERLASEQHQRSATSCSRSPTRARPVGHGLRARGTAPFADGALIKNRYVGRTFIQPDQQLREQGVKLKFNPLAEVAGKRVVVVDDSIVRGNTTRKIVQMLFEAGAAEVHVRISSPPVIGQCFYGMDFADEDELIASSRSVEEVREHIGATSLAHLSLEGLQDSTQRRPRSSAARASRGTTRRQSRVRARSSGSSRHFGASYCSRTRLALAIPRLPPRPRRGSLS